MRKPVGARSTIAFARASIVVPGVRKTELPGFTSSAAARPMAAFPRRLDMPQSVVGFEVLRLALAPPGGAGASPAPKLLKVAPEGLRRHLEAAAHPLDRAYPRREDIQNFAVALFEVPHGGIMPSFAIGKRVRFRKRMLRERKASCIIGCDRVMGPARPQHEGRKIVCVGNLVHDEVFQVEALPASGIKTGVLGYQSRFGGPAATAAVAISRLGGTAAYWGRVADRDAAGHAAGSGPSTEYGVDCAGVAMISEGRTLRAIVLVDAGGERSIVSDRRSLPVDAAVLPADPLADVAVVLVDSRWPAGAEIALDRARAANVQTVLDADGGASAKTSA